MHGVTTLYTFNMKQGHDFRCSYDSDPQYGFLARAVALALTARNVFEVRELIGAIEASERYAANLVILL